MGLAVDELRDVQRVNRGAIEPPEPLRLAQTVWSAGRSDADVVVLLDLGRIVTLTFL